MTVNGSFPTDKQHRQIALLTLVLLLLLRIPYTIAIIYFLPIENQTGGSVYEISTYALTCFLIWWERDRLEDFHIDPIALSFIIFLRPLQTLILTYWKVDSPLAFPHPPGLILWGISLGLLFALFKSGFKPARVSSRILSWLTFGILAGVVVSVIENMTTFLSGLNNASGSSSPALLGSSSLVLLYHLGFAPINEEPLFRGFLWGQLRQRKWSEASILFFQAVLFTSAHVYFAEQYPLMFWVMIPSAALLFGLLSWRTRSITPAILAHGMINGSVYVWIMNFVGWFK
jgi:membrane protease YdiL (CAAX protease family)